MLRKHNPIIDSFRMHGLHHLQEETTPGGQEEVDMASFGDAVMALTKYDVAETQLYLADRQTALGATLSSMTMATWYPVVA